MTFPNRRKQFNGKRNNVVGVSIVESDFYRPISIRCVVRLLNDLLQ